MSNYAVIGLGYGDEGKGVVTDFLSRTLKESSVVIRFSGGHQAGHTVQLSDGTRHVFSNFGSGTLAYLPTYWSKYCTFDPLGMKNELVKLQNMGYNPEIFINKLSPLVTPYDKKYNKVSEEARHGTCGVGFGKTIEREESFYSLVAMDIYYPRILREKIDLLKEHYYYHINVTEEDMKNFYDAIEYLKEYEELVLTDIEPEDTGFINKIYEGSQGLLLSQDIGFFPHVTRSYTGLQRVPDSEVYYVTRAYSTRHGAGPFIEGGYPEDYFTKAAGDEYETNKTNIYQGEFRRGILDLDVLKYGLNKHLSVYGENTTSNLVVTCMDHVKPPYMIRHNNKVLELNTKEQFLLMIKAALGVDFKETFTNWSPVGNLVKEFV